MQKYFTLGEAAKRIQEIDGKRPHPSTLFRWYDRGIGGVRLECIRVGRKLAVTEEALDKFFREAGAAGPIRRQPRISKPAPRKRTERQRQAGVDAAKASLRRNGIEL